MLFAEYVAVKVDVVFTGTVKGMQKGAQQMY